MSAVPSMAHMHPVLPSQYVSRRGAGRSDPQRRLMIAVVQTALDDCAWTLQEGGPTGRRPLPGERHDALAFLMSQDRTWPFSFENICDAVGLDADSIRRRLWALHATLQTER